MMYKVITILVIFYFTTTYSLSQVITVAEARALGLGNTVTISGIITNGPELGTIRYMQDTTAGMAVYYYNFSQQAGRNDSVTVTGTIKNYNNLLELDPVKTWTVHSSGNDLPDPAVITPSQLDESYESQIVKIENATFDAGGGTFSSGTYSFTANSQSGIIYIRSNHPLIGEVIPGGKTTLIGICHQHYSTYELLLRDTDDIILESAINITSQVTVSDLSQ